MYQPQDDRRRQPQNQQRGPLQNQQGQNQGPPQPQYKVRGRGRGGGRGRGRGARQDEDDDNSQGQRGGRGGRNDRRQFTNSNQPQQQQHNNQLYRQVPQFQRGTPFEKRGQQERYVDSDDGDDVNNITTPIPTIINIPRHEDNPIIIMAQELDQREYEDETDSKIYPHLPMLEDLQIFKQSYGEIYPLQTDSEATVKAFLENHFFLLREDLIRDFREAIANQLKSQGFYPDLVKQLRKQLHVYEDIRFISFKILQRELCLNIALRIYQEQKHNLQWKRSKRLMPGNLLLITNKSFTQLIPAYIMIRDNIQNDYLENGIVYLSIKLASADHLREFIKLIRDEHCVGVENRIYYEGFRNHLLVLKEMIEENSLPFSDLLLGKQNAYLGYESAPEYLEDDYPNVEYKIQGFQSQDEYRINIFEKKEWQVLKNQLDESQIEALQTIVSQKIALIQGPPGTGKTYVGALGVKQLLRNQHGRTGPILIVCYTNHALDQFLEHIIKFVNIKDVVRIGSRTKVEKLIPCLLKNKRDNVKITFPWKNFGEIENRLDDSIKDLLKSLSHSKPGFDSFSKSDYMDLIVEDLLESLRLVKRNRIHEKQVKKIFHLWLDYEKVPEKEILEIIQDEIDFHGNSFGEDYREKIINYCRDQRQKKKLTLTSQKFNPPQPESESDDDQQENPLTPQEQQIIQKYTNGQVNLWTFAGSERNLIAQTQKNYRKFLLDDTLALLNLRPQKPFLKENIDNLEEVWKNAQFISQPQLLKLIESEKNKNRNIFNQDPIQAIDDFFMKDLDQSIDQSSISQSELGSESEEESSEEENEFIQSVKDKQKEQKDIQLDTESQYSVKSEIKNLQADQIDLDTLDEQLAEGQRIWSYDLKTRRSIFQSVFEKNKKPWEVCCQEVEEVNKRYTVYSREIAKQFQMRDAKYIGEHKIVGVTVSGMAKYMETFRSLKPEIMIIEEAGEVLEGHTISILNENLKHLILIGDHQQLRPKVNSHELTSKYNFNISLFERFVQQDIPLCTLKYQRRMKTHLADQIRLVYGIERYNDETQAVDFKNQFKFQYLPKDLFYYNIQSLENHNPISLSYNNVFEAEMIHGFVHFLINHEKIDADRITIITMYTDQLFKLQNLFKDSRLRILVTTVDNYQGEENDFVILSLVRSNQKGSLGFVSDENRMNVALSRARLGLFIFGNTDCIWDYTDKLKKKQIMSKWRKILVLAQKRSQVIDDISFECPSHKQVVYSVKQPRDWNGVKFTCNQRCQKPCARGIHKCQFVCHKTCPTSCEQLYEAELKCGHKNQIKCNSDPDKHPCDHDIKRTFNCGIHEGLLKCHIDPKSHKCTFSVEKMLDCGHVTKVQCYYAKEPTLCQEDHTISKDCGHELVVKCCQKDQDHPCREKIKVSLNCGHTITRKCEEINLPYQCMQDCNRLLLCGHKCPRKCFERCLEVQCQVDVHENMPGCSHLAKRKCWQTLKFRCNQVCEVPLDCKHDCPKICQDCKETKMHGACLEQKELEFDKNKIIIKCGDLFIYCTGCDLKIYDYKSDQPYFGGKGKIAFMRSKPPLSNNDDDALQPLIKFYKDLIDSSQQLSHPQKQILLNIQKQSFFVALSVRRIMLLYPVIKFLTETQTNDQQILRCLQNTLNCYQDLTLMLAMTKNSRFDHFVRSCLKLYLYFGLQVMNDQQQQQSDQTIQQIGVNNQQGFNIDEMVNDDQLIQMMTELPQRLQLSEIKMLLDSKDLQSMIQSKPECWQCKKSQDLLLKPFFIDKNKNKNGKQRNN